MHRMGQDRVRIEEVATLAGVSTATVSRVLSNPQIVAPLRRDKVLSAIEALGYVPHPTARALASGRTYTVGCVVPTIDHAIFAKSTQSLQKTLLASGYQLLIAGHEYDLQTEYHVMSALQQRGVDALVLVGTDHLPATWRAIKAWGKPCVLNWSCDPRLPSIGFDNRAVSRVLAEHLLGLGHRVIGMISGFTQHNDRARSRIEGVRSAMVSAGFALLDKHVTEQGFGLAGGRRGFEQLMRLKIRPTAIVCGNDLLAAGAVMQAQRMGMDVPRDVSICGVDNHELSQELHPALTTVSLPTEELGRVTAQQIVAALAGAPLAKKRLLPIELIVRESTVVCARLSK